MFDFFAEIAENTTQITTIVNWGISFIQQVYYTVIGSDGVRIMLGSLSALPLPIASLVTFMFSTAVFDFIRGR